VVRRVLAAHYRPDRRDHLGFRGHSLRPQREHRQSKRSKNLLFHSGSRLI
jgi:hypothetical protein